VPSDMPLAENRLASSSPEMCCWNSSSSNSFTARGGHPPYIGHHLREILVDPLRHSWMIFDEPP